MQKDLNKLVEDFPSWRGNNYALAKLAAELAKERVVEILTADGVTQETIDKVSAL